MRVSPDELTPKYVTPKDVATLFRISKNTVIKRFANLPGVIDLGTDKRHQLRIPRVLVENWGRPRK